MLSEVQRSRNISTDSSTTLRSVQNDKPVMLSGAKQSKNISKTLCHVELPIAIGMQRSQINFIYPKKSEIIALFSNSFFLGVSPVNSLIPFINVIGHNIQPYKPIRLIC